MQTFISPLRRGGGAGGWLSLLGLGWGGVCGCTTDFLILSMLLRYRLAELPLCPPAHRLNEAIYSPMYYGLKWTTTWQGPNKDKGCHIFGRMSDQELCVLSLRLWETVASNFKMEIVQLGGCSRVLTTMTQSQVLVKKYFLPFISEGQSNGV